MKATTVAVIGAAAGVSTIFLGAAPASAATPQCGAVGTLIPSTNICEQTFTTAGAATFTRTADMTQLEVLLVGAGGSGGNADAADSYAANGGGGGDVQVVDFSPDTAQTTLTLNVGSGGASSTATDTVVSGTASAGSSSFIGNPGNSGSGMAGVPGGGGGGAGAAAAGANGGAGKQVSTIAPSGSLFAGDTNCYGGGGAEGTFGGTLGTATCGGGTVADGATATTIVSPVANSGGGGGGGDENSDQPGNVAGADGLVVVRWNAATVTLTFNNDGHGAAIASEAVVTGSAPTRPADPSATGWVFRGWYTDPSFTTAADFSAPLTAATTFFARWTPTLAVTGDPLNPFEIPLGAGALATGLGLALIAARRRSRRVA
jgi:uncharacterized repeat protein (TIGR02543 family)